MPLIVMCGFPCSGKTTRALEIQAALQERGHSVVLVGDAQLQLDPAKVYASSAEEKKARGAIKAAVERSLTASTCVIVDSGNYIKGFRYELYCVARSLKSTNCVVQPAAIPELCHQRHQDGGLVYGSEELIDQLIQRFEFPDNRQRWDKPLFTIAAEEPLPTDELMAALFESKAAAPRYSTQSQPLSSSDFLTQLDQITKDIVSVCDTSLSGFYVSDTPSFSPVCRR